MKRKIIIYFFSAFLVAVIGFIGIERSPAAQPIILRHYTDIIGFHSIEQDQLILTDKKGRVYLTPAEYTEAQAFNALFIGNPIYKGKGSHLFVLKMKPDAVLKAGTQPNEVIFEGTLRFGKHADVIYAGINTKK